MHPTPTGPSWMSNKRFHVMMTAAMGNSFQLDNHMFNVNSVGLTIFNSRRQQMRTNQCSENLPFFSNLQFKNRMSKISILTLLNIMQAYSTKLNSAFHKIKQ